MRGFLALLVGLVVGVGIFWVYMTYTITQPTDPAWIAINSRLPAQARGWACREVKTRLGATGAAPPGCEEFWR